MNTARNILSQLKNKLGVQTDKELAEYLGITTSQMGYWKSANKINVHLVVQKFDFAELPEIFGVNIFEMNDMAKWRGSLDLNRKFYYGKKKEFTEYLSNNGNKKVYLYYVKFNYEEGGLKGYIIEANAQILTFSSQDETQHHIYNSITYNNKTSAVQAIYDGYYIGIGPDGENCRITKYKEHAITDIFKIIHIRNIYHSIIDGFCFNIFEQSYPELEIVFTDDNNITSIIEEEEIEQSWEFCKDANLDPIASNDIQVYCKMDKYNKKNLECSSTEEIVDEKAELIYDYLNELVEEQYKHLELTKEDKEAIELMTKEDKNDDELENTIENDIQN